jgi:hypothetical protein
VSVPVSTPSSGISPGGSYGNRRAATIFDGRMRGGCPGGGVSPSGSDLGSRVGGWPGRSLGSCLTRPVGSHHKGDPPGRPARLEVAHRVRCGA